MLNIKEIRNNPDFFIQNLKKRNLDNSEKLIKEILDLDKEYREFLEKKEKLLSSRNQISKELGQKKNDQTKFNELSKKVSDIKKQVQELDDQS